MACLSLPAESSQSWGKSTPWPRSRYFLEVETSSQQSEQKCSCVQIIIHSLLVKMVNQLCSYSLGLLLLNISCHPVCDVQAVHVIRLRCCLKAGRTAGYIILCSRYWLGFVSLQGQFFQHLSIHWLITPWLRFHNASLRKSWAEVWPSLLSPCLYDQFFNTFSWRQLNSSHALSAALPLFAHTQQCRHLLFTSFLLMANTVHQAKLWYISESFQDYLWCLVSGRSVRFSTYLFNTVSVCVCVSCIWLFVWVNGSQFFWQLTFKINFWDLWFFLTHP